jgi:hypothetical protein
MIGSGVRVFWSWYERHYALNLAIAAGLLLLQVIHLAWLFGEVIVWRLAGEPLFVLDGVLRWPLVLVDYAEIPALLSVSLIYANELRRRFDAHSGGLLLLLNSQWLHIFWITDEFVLGSFGQRAAAASLPIWLAWIAISIDYLEVPVIVDTLRRMVGAFQPAPAHPRGGERVATP